MLVHPCLVKTTPRYLQDGQNTNAKFSIIFSIRYSLSWVQENLSIVPLERVTGYSLFAFHWSRRNKIRYIKSELVRWELSTAGLSSTAQAWSLSAALRLGPCLLGSILSMLKRQWHLNPFSITKWGALLLLNGQGLKECQSHKLNYGSNEERGSCICHMCISLYKL